MYSLKALNKLVEKCFDFSVCCTVLKHGNCISVADCHLTIMIMYMYTWWLHPFSSLTSDRVFKKIYYTSQFLFLYFIHFIILLQMWCCVLCHQNLNLHWNFVRLTTKYRMKNLIKWCRHSWKPIGLNLIESQPYWLQSEVCGRKPTSLNELYQSYQEKW